MLRAVSHSLLNGRHGADISFSPHSPDLVAVIANDNYGITGAGELAVVSVNSDVKTGVQFKGHSSVFPHSEALTSLCWCSHNSSHVLTGCRDGTALLWDTNQPQSSAALQSYSGPSKEVSSIAMPVTPGQHFVTSSWDGTLLLYDFSRSSPLSAVDKVMSLLYEVSWSPLRMDTFATAAGDGCVRVYHNNLRGLVLPMGPNVDVLSVHWSYTDTNILASAGTDAVVRVWDLRNPQTPVMLMQGHEKAVNKVRFSPHLPSTLATSSYDFTTRVWSAESAVLTSSSHSEFCTSVSWNKVTPGLLADCSYDATMVLYVL